MIAALLLQTAAVPKRIKRAFSFSSEVKNTGRAYLGGTYQPVSGQTHTDTPVNDLTKPHLPFFILLKSYRLNAFSILQLTTNCHI